jgi:hypothetical protein
MQPVNVQYFVAIATATFLTTMIILTFDRTYTITYTTKLRVIIFGGDPETER